MRLMHTMLRVANLERSIAFYTKVMQMQLLRLQEYPEGEFTLAFLGYGDEASNTVLELTYNWASGNYDLGNAYGHIAVEVEDVYQACEQIRAAGGQVTREAGPMKAGTSILAFCEDPDGYPIQLLGKRGLQ
ncbi:lactoylglutathione lyase [Pseudoteredinibacter isoporae]|uniref:lactoylglutathione lyase n=1 Tax=Pseudoteredinibacter isoporae TaxID=570281 RepID=UPI003104CC2D